MNKNNKIKSQTLTEIKVEISDSLTFQTGFRPFMKIVNDGETKIVNNLLP